MSQSSAASRSVQATLRRFPGRFSHASLLSYGWIAKPPRWGRFVCGVALCVILSLACGCKNLQKKGVQDEVAPWPEQADWSDFPEFQDSPGMTKQKTEKKGILGFLQNDRQAAGLSSEARDIERRFGYR